MKELTRTTRRLAEFQVEFVVAGGLANLIHGSALMTRDVDVACPMNPENLLRLFEALESLHPVHRMTPQRLPFTREQIQENRLSNIYLSTDWGQLDCLGEIKGIGDYQACLARSVTIDLDGMEIRVLSLDALIESKRAMGRPRDLHAVLELEAIRERTRI
ncbi:MAG: hypothetical protein SNJ84_05135 [Verrucomicrobiia bacterium]